MPQGISEAAKPLKSVKTAPFCRLLNKNSFKTMKNG
jgi:hypothetical protein